METIKVKHDNPFGYKIINAEDLTEDMEIYDEVEESANISEDIQDDDTQDLPPVVEVKPVTKRKPAIKQ